MRTPTTLATLLIAAALLAPASTRAQAPQPRDRPFEVKLVMGEDPPSERVYRVIQDDVAVIRIESDRSGEARVSGYGTSVHVSARKPTELRVPAKDLGEFRIDFRPTKSGAIRLRDIVIGRLDVRPR